jgi:hypothetical protein
MMSYIQDKKNLTLPESLQPWAQQLVMIDDDNLRGAVCDNHLSRFYQKRGDVLHCRAEAVK